MVVSLKSTAQCLNDWKYRVPILIDNRLGETLTSYQLSLSINMSELIANSKMKNNGADIRFTDKEGTILPHWIEETTLNTTAATIWVKLADLEVAEDTIYLFYGNGAVSSTSDGEATFPFFDDFSNTLDPDKWVNCGSSTVDISSERLVLSGNTVLYGRTQVESPHYVEAHFSSLASDALTSIGMYDSNGVSPEGYTLSLDNRTGELLQTRSVQTEAGTCLETNAAGVLGVPSGADLLDKWRFAWTNTNEQILEWPGNTLTQAAAIHATYPSHMYPIILQEDLSAGSTQIDWFFTRKYTAVPPTIVLAPEEELAGSFEIVGQSAACEGDSIALSVPDLMGASYQWEFTGLGDLGVDNDTLVIDPLDLIDQGTYTASITLGVCTFTSEIEVVVDATTEAGLLTGEANVCAGNIDINTIKLSGQLGDVVRWESSATGFLPWATLNNTTDSLEYQALIQDTYYRAVVQHGVCLEAYTDPLKITVDDPSLGGDIIGDVNVCKYLNAGNLSLIGQRGTILKWQSSANLTDWTDISFSGNTYAFTNLDTTTHYRAIVKNGFCDNDTSDLATVTVYELPVVSFTSDTACYGEATSFNTPSVLSYSWNFGNGQGSSLQNPQFVFPASGKTPVSLTITDVNTCSNTVIDTVVVEKSPTVVFSLDDVCDSTDVFLQNQSSITDPTVTHFIWDFLGNGTETIVTSKKDTSIAYEAGTYDVQLTGVSEQGCEASYTQTLQVYPEPTTAFMLSEDTIITGGTVVFSNNSSASSYGLSYQWNFGTSVPADTSNAINPSFQYNVAGTYAVNLTAKTNTNPVCQERATHEVTVIDAPNVDFEFSNVCLNEATSFTNLSVSTEPILYIWDFGDGTKDTINTPVFTREFTSSGSFLVSLQAVTSQTTTSVSKFVNVYPLPTARFTVDDACIGTTNSFQNTSTISSGSMSYTWDLGDGTTVTDDFPFHQYVTDGIYEVEMIASSNYSCKDTVTTELTIYPLPSPDFNFSLECDGDTTDFTDLSTMASLGTETLSIASYLWSFGDGTTSTDQNPQKRYFNAGNFTVSLKTTSNKGCVSEVSDNVVVKENPVADFSITTGSCETLSFVNSSYVPENITPAYIWSFGDGELSTDQHPTYTYSAVGSYYTTLKLTANGCIDSTIQLVNAYNSPIAVVSELNQDTVISLGDSVSLTVNIDNAQSYSWIATNTTIAEVLSPQAQETVIIPKETSQFQVIGIDANGCEFEDSITITVNRDYLVTPTNLITPDGNDQNDAWIIRNIENYGDCHVQVFNRWGDLVFEDDAYQNDWKGTRGNDILPDGTYFYLLTFSGNSTVYKGAISIMRNEQ